MQSFDSNIRRLETERNFKLPPYVLHPENKYLGI